MSGSFFAHFKLPGGVRRRAGFLLPLLLLALVLAACGGATGSNTANYSTASQSGNNQAGGGQPAATPGTGGGSAGPPTLPNGTPVSTYLIRTLSVSLVVNNPLDVEHLITRDILSLDPLAQGAGEQINQQSDGTYKVAVTFAISSPKYATVKDYLGTFSATNPTYKGKLISENETVQNVTSQYVDLQSRLKNLQVEQQRLLQLMSQAQNLSDTLTLQDKLTDVEGQIEQIEGQINDLAGQTAYSMITVNLSSTTPPLPPPPAPPKQWSPGDIFSSAVSVMIAILQVVIDILIWVGVFAVFWLPILAGVYVWRRLRQRLVKPGTSGLSTP
ncbi:MAG TPA: DUF4349 domain-containing protein [Ktedonobacterales bacterium]|nr:DUF4349 domain-containing protein [Ktedonobacterales bacterium]